MLRDRRVYALAALIAAGSVFVGASAAHASTVSFASTTAVADTLADPMLTYTSAGLNATLTVGTEYDISNFITAQFGNSSFSDAGTDFNITATFLFSVPTPLGTTTDGGTILATAKVNGRGGAPASVDITWSDPVIFTFQNGTALSVDLVNTLYSCASSCNNESFSIEGKFTTLNGQSSQLSETPIPAALPLFASGLGALGLLGWRRKRKAQAA